MIKMTEMEVKSLKAQIELLKGITDADSIILHAVQLTASQILNNVVNPKMHIKEGQKKVELTVEEFAKIHVCLTQISSEEGFCQMNAWIQQKYIEPKKEKNKILSILQ